MRWFLPLLLVPIVACSGSQAPAGPSAQTPASSAITVRGRAVGTQDRAPLGGLTATVGGQTAQTAADGTFAVTMAPAPSLTVLLQGPGIVTRRVTAAGDGHSVDVDAFRLDGPFDLAFYRQLVRNGFEAPGALDTWHRQPSNPPIYIRTVDEAGAPIPAAQLDATEAAIRAVVPLWTGGLYTVVQLQRGSAPAPVNWLGIEWSANVPSDGKCGISPPGSLRVDLRPKLNGCGCGGLAISARAVKHELGHAFGFFHTDNPNDVMWHASLTCDLDPSVRERYHAALAYRRPIGNTDPDNDP